MIRSPLIYPGRAKYSIEQVSGDAGWNAGGTYKLSPAPELFAEIGTDGGLFDVNGVPAERTQAQILAIGGNKISVGGQSTCAAPLPVSGQVFKSHALPISAKKLTVFPGVASNAQINEAQ